MSWETIGLGAGGGFVTGILAALGLHFRISKNELNKQDKEVCSAVHRAIDYRLERIENKLDTIIKFNGMGR